ncbi:MAG: hypothetical protein K6L74_17175 [Neptuniibacter sp.]
MAVQENNKEEDSGLVGKDSIENNELSEDTIREALNDRVEHYKKTSSIDNSLFWDMVDENINNNSAMEADKVIDYFIGIKKDVLLEKTEIEKKHVAEIIESNTEKSHELVELLFAIRTSVDALLEGAEFNDLGLPLHPLEVEVKKMIDSANNGIHIVPAYDGKKWKSPLKYLENHYGKYLKSFGAERDYLYLDDLKQIDGSFYSTLVSHKNRYPESFNNCVLAKEARLALEDELAAKIITSLDVRKANKIKQLKAKKVI